MNEKLITNEGVNNEYPIRGQNLSLLSTLLNARQDERIATREDLKAALAEGNRDNHIVVSDSHLDVAIHYLRRSLENRGSEFRIETIRGFGYEIKGPSEDKNLS